MNTLSVQLSEFLRYIQVRETGETVHQFVVMCTILNCILAKFSCALQRAKVNNEKTFPSMISLTAGIDRSKLTLI